MTVLTWRMLTVAALTVVVLTATLRRVLLPRSTYQERPLPGHHLLRGSSTSALLTPRGQRVGSSSSTPNPDPSLTNSNPNLTLTFPDLSLTLP